MPSNAGWTMNVGASFSAIKSNYNTVEQAFSNTKSAYLLSFDKKRQEISIVLSEDSDIDDQLKACIQAEMIIFLHEFPSTNIHQTLSHLGEFDEWNSNQDTGSLIRSTFLATEKLFPSLRKELEIEGWRPDLCLLSTDEWRSSWNFESGISRKND